MTKYTIKEHTPLKFHWFFTHISLPLTILAGIGQLIPAIKAARENLDVVGIINITYYSLLVVLCAICLEEFPKKNSYFLRFLSGLFSLNIIYCVTELILYVNYLPEEVSQAAAQLIVHSVFALLVGIYYWKRRRLFYCPLIEKKPLNIPPSTVVVHTTRFCRKCGSLLSNDDDSFCSKCGTKTIIVTESCNIN